MTEYKFDYVILNYPDPIEFLKDNPDGYYAICLEDLKGIRGVTVVNYALEGKNSVIKFVYRLVNSFVDRTNGFLGSNKLLSLFYPFYIPRTKGSVKKKCFVFISDPWNVNYIKYLKKRYPDCKIVMALRDLVNTKWFYKELKETGLIDLWMSYDEGECIKYNMLHFSQFESAINICRNDSIPKSDVFFAGRAKNRLSMLIECYDHLTSIGQQCLFFILDAPVTEKKVRKGIIYANEPMSYRTMLEYIINSKCILDINQEGAIGFTSRFLEAIIYNKLLLTNTPSVRFHSLYNEKFIKVFNNTKEIKSSFFQQADSVDYNYNGEFSPISFLDTLNSAL